MLKASNVDVVEGAVPVKFTADTVTYSKDGKEEVADSDTIILATGYHPLKGLADELDKLSISYDVIGNAVKARKIINATGEAYQAIRRL